MFEISSPLPPTWFRLLLALMMLQGVTVANDADPREEPAHTPLQIFREQLKKTEPMCTQGLGNAYGLDGLATPKTDLKGWYFCPFMKATCCTDKDEESGFSIAKGGLSKLNKIFNVYTKMITEYIDQLIASRAIAGRVNNRLAKIKFANCKVLASKIVLYDIAKVKTNIIEALNQSYKFMLNSYRGFYCEICDAEKNKFVFNEEGFVVLHKNQCRETVMATIKVLYYLRVLFANFSNLVVKFLNNCDAKGAFYDDPMMTQLTISITQEDKIVERCWNDRNTPKWLEECKDYCDRFNFVNLNEFFRPHAYRFGIITEFIKIRNNQIISDEATDSSVDLPPAVGTPGFMDDEGTNEAPPLKFLNKFGDKEYAVADEKVKKLIASMGDSNSIITAITGIGTPIDSHTYVYMEKGLDFVTSGKQTLIGTTDDAKDPKEAMSDHASFKVTGSYAKSTAPKRNLKGGGNHQEEDNDVVAELTKEGESMAHRHHRALQTASVASTFILYIISVLLWSQI